MRASRLLSILLLLQTRGRMTADELAEVLEVSVRTVYRDMTSLAAAGIPLYGDAGHRGGYRLLAGHRTRLTGLTTAEAAVLFLTGLPGAAADLGRGPDVAAARLKLLAALPEELRGQADRMARRFHLDAPAWYQAAEHPPHLTAIADAVGRARRLRIRYSRWSEPHEVSRVVEPYGVVLKSGIWYLVARHDERFRTYRVARILALEETGESFDHLPGFDLAAHWEDYLAGFDSRRHRGEATLRVSPAAVEVLPQVMDPAVAEAALRSATAVDPDGWCRVTLPIESVEHAHSEILKLGGQAEVLAPEELRRRMVDTVRALADLYGTGSTEREKPQARPEKNRSDLGFCCAPSGT